jgi:hypothetical protein
VKALEAEKGQVAPSPDVAVPTTTAPDQVSDRIRAIEAWDKTHGIQWRGFGEVNYKVLDQRTPELATGGFNPGSAGNFYTANATLLLTSRISDKASVLSEVEFEEEGAQAYSVSLERILLKYDYDDHLKYVVWPVPHWYRLLEPRSTPEHGCKLPRRPFFRYQYINGSAHNRFTKMSACVTARLSALATI